MAAGIRYPQGIDIIVKTNAEPVGKEMRDVIFADVQLFLEQFERQLTAEVACTVAHHALQCVGTPRPILSKRHHTEKLTEKCLQSTADDRIPPGGVFIVLPCRHLQELQKPRVGIRMTKQRGGGQLLGKGTAQLGHQIGRKNEEHIPLRAVRDKLMQLVGENHKDIPRLNGIFN